MSSLIESSILRVTPSGEGLDALERNLKPSVTVSSRLHARASFGLSICIRSHYAVIHAYDEYRTMDEAPTSNEYSQRNATIGVTACTCRFSYHLSITSRLVPLFAKLNSRA